VTDASGSPVSGIEVRILKSGGVGVMGASGVTNAKTTTDADGAYAFGRLLPGGYLVEIRRTSGQVHQAGVWIAEGRPARLDFPEGAALVGEILEGAGKPVSGASVRAQRVEGPSMWGPQVSTDDQGRFRIDRLVPGEWSVHVQTRGEGAFAAEVARVTIGNGATAVTIELDRGEIAGCIGGRVFEKATGRGLSKAEVQLTMLALRAGEGGEVVPGGWIGMAFPNETGAYRFRALREGKYRITARPYSQGLRPWDGDLEVRAGERKEGVEIALEAAKPGVLRILVSDESGHPLADVEIVTVVKEEISGGVITTTTAPLSGIGTEPGVLEAHTEPGQKTLLVSKAGFQAQRVIAHVVEGETSKVDVVLYPK
jgi:hypothetical protein